MTSPFITGQYYLPSGESLTILDNKLYIIQCLDESGNIDTFTVHGSGKSVDGKFALIISGGPVPPHPGPNLSTSLAIVQTGSIVLSELARTAVSITTVSPKSSKSKIYYYVIDGTLEAFKGDKGDTGPQGPQGVSAPNLCRVTIQGLIGGNNLNAIMLGAYEKDILSSFSNFSNWVLQKSPMAIGYYIKDNVSKNIFNVAKFGNDVEFEYTGTSGTNSVSINATNFSDITFRMVKQWSL